MEKKAMPNRFGLTFLRSARIPILFGILLTVQQRHQIAQVNPPSVRLHKHVVALAANGGPLQTTPAFDVVSIKPNNTGRIGNLGIISDTYTAEGAPIDATIGYAYLPLTTRWLISLGGPSWVGSERFDIVAKMDSDTAARIKSLSIRERDAIVQPMLQKMLSDRFGLVVHRAPTKLSGYTLTVGPRGSRLEPSLPSDVIPQEAKDGMDGSKVVRIHKRGHTPEIDYFAMPIAALAHELSIAQSTLIVDETGLAGIYNFKLIPLYDETITGGVGPQIDNRFQNALPWDLERLGLRLKAAQVKTDTVVIDSIHHPTPN